MSIRLEKTWQALTEEGVQRLSGQLGVYQIGDPNGRVVFIGYAGGRSLFGLRGELERQWQQRRGDGSQFRLEITTQYLTRYQELLMLHIADHGGPPRDNADNLPPGLGRLSPA